jgi:hypothetical protein
MGAVLFEAGQFEAISFGGYGMRLLNGGETSLLDETFGAIQITLDAVISFNNLTSRGDSVITNISLTAGQVVYGNMTTINVVSGQAIGYLRAL